MRLTGGEVFVESGSNDTWFLSGETVLQVCYRGNVDRLVQEAELLAVLPGGEPGPAVLDHGRDRLMSWLVVVLARSAAAECPETETDPVAIAASTLTPLSASQLGRLMEHARAAPFADQDVLDTIAARLAGVAARITISRDADVVLQGDCTAANALVQDGRVVALVDLNGPGAARGTSR